jgi:Tol biopolymer transport system component/DNA-binding winged helix-turn-helix (wHTH) protein
LPVGSRPVYEFGPFRLDVAEQLLLREGLPLPLTPKVFDVLRVLVENSGHLVGKERLLAEVWPDSFVEEGALSRSISILRKTLDENGSDQKYIETVPKRGYRFVAPVAELDGRTDPVVPAGPTPVDSLTEPESIGDASTARAGWARRSRWAAGILGALLLIGALAEFGRGNRGSTGREADDRATGGSAAVAPVHRQVTFTGKERAPAISPDGRRIAYVSYEKPDKKLVVQELAGGPPLTIFTAPEIGYLRWSPDGTELIVWARGSGRSGVYVVPQMGGALRTIAPGQFIACWSPDGSTIAVASYLNGKIWFYDKSGKLQRTASLRDVNWSIWDIDWSVNGVLTFVSSDYQGRYRLWTVKPDGSEQRRLVDSDTEIPSVRWSPGGDAIYYLRRLNQTFSLFKIPAETGPDVHSPVPTTLIAGIEIDRLFALSGDGRRLVYARAPYYSNLWLADAGDGHGEDVETRELTSGTSLVERPSVSPDGASIAFNIGHEPVTNLYTMPVTGGVPRQLTFRDSLNLEAAWSVDGKRIAFASTEGGRPRVWTVSAGGGEPLALSSSDMSDTFDLTWSPGPRILFQQPGNRNYYELDPDTRAERFLINDSSVGWIFSPVYSPDGRKIAAHWNRPRDRPSNRGIYVIDAKDRRERLVFETSAAGISGDSVRPVGWSADSRSIYVLEGKVLNLRGLTSPGGETTTEARILRVAVTGDDVKTVAALPFEEIGGVSMTPDGRRFVCAVYSSRSDVWVVDNFDPSP